MMPEKKKRRVLTIEDRVTILQRLERGEKGIELADEYGISKSAISHLKSRMPHIMEQKKALEECGSSIKRKRYTGIEKTLREKSLYLWMAQKRDIGDRISGPSITKRALLFNEELEGPAGFKASPGFLHRFKKRHAILASKIQNVNSSTDTVTSENFCKKFAQFCQYNGYGPDQVYNADETGLHWKMLPTRKLVSSNETEAPDREAVRDRVTVMCCTNASGTQKIPLMVIGKSQEPGCFKNIRSLPVEWRAQKGAWTTKEITLDWYRNVFIPAVKEKHESDRKKVVLLLDNAQCHPEVEEFEAISDICKVMILPSNVTALLQPMNQGIIEKMKKVYKHNLLRLILTAETDQRVTDLIESINMLNVCNFLAYAWEEVNATNIRNAWKEIFPLEGDLSESSEIQLSGRDVLDMIQLLPECSEAKLNDAEAWLNSDANDPGWRLLPHNELLARIENGTEETDASEGSEDEEEEERLNEDSVCKRTMLHSLNSIIAWYQTKWNSSTQQVMFLESLRKNMVSDILVDNGTSL